MPSRASSSRALGGRRPRARRSRGSQPSRAKERALHAAHRERRRLAIASARRRAAGASSRPRPASCRSRPIAAPRRAREEPAREEVIMPRHADEARQQVARRHAPREAELREASRRSARRAGAVRDELFEHPSPIPPRRGRSWRAIVGTSTPGRRRGNGPRSSAYGAARGVEARSLDHGCDDRPPAHDVRPGRVAPAKSFAASQVGPRRGEAHRRVTASPRSANSRSGCACATEPATPRIDAPGDMSLRRARGRDQGERVASSARRSRAEARGSQR